MIAILDIKGDWHKKKKMPTVWSKEDPYHPSKVKKLVIPEITENQELGELYLDVEKDVVTYIIVDYTVEEIKANELSNASTVSSIQFLTQLELEGITQEAILGVIETLPKDKRILAKVSFQRAVNFHRNNPFVSLVGVVFKRSKSQLDDIFIKASKIEI